MKIGLVLSGGGAKGFAHIGVIRRLEQLGLKPYCISGTSMGSLIGGWYAAGKDLAVIEQMARSGAWKHFLPLRQIFNSVRQSCGLFRMDSFENFMAKEIGDSAIEKLAIPYCAIATSLKKGAEVRLQNGSLLKAIMASSCIPIVFAPIEHQNDLLVDGGVVNNFPIQACFDMGADVVIGVDVRYTPGDIGHELIHEHNMMRWKIFRVLSYLMDMVHPTEQTYNTQKVVVIKPYISHIQTFDFQRVDEIIKLGAEAFGQKEKEIRALTGLSGN